MITIQKYVRAQSLEEAWQLNQNKRNRILGGMLWLRLGKGSVNTAIDLCDLGLDTIEETEEAFSIGAMATLRDLEMHEGLNAYSSNAVRNAVKDIVGVQFRNMATVGGSIWGRFGFSDVLTVFLALAVVLLLFLRGIVRKHFNPHLTKTNYITPLCINPVHHHCTTINGLLKFFHCYGCLIFKVSCPLPYFTVNNTAISWKIKIHTTVNHIKFKVMLLTPYPLLTVS